MTSAVRGASKIASRLKTSMMGVVAATAPATSARVRPISTVPSAVVRATIATAPSTEGSRAAVSQTPKTRKAAAASQNQSTGLSR